MDDLIAFIGERLDEDQRLAQAAQLPNTERGGGPSWTATSGVDGVDGPVLYRDGDIPSEAQEQHMARHDPARVLADVAAKRGAVDVCAHNLEFEEHGYTLAERVLRALASTYADHPDYRAHWAPRDDQR